MPVEINETHDPNLRSWVESANDPQSDFPIQNLPWCALKAEDREGSAGVRIGDRVLDLTALTAESPTLLPLEPQARPSAILRLDRRARGRLRAALQSILRRDSMPARAAIERSLLPAAQVELVPPTGVVPNYTDFYASIHHAERVGSMFRPDNPLLPNYKWVPIGYHGRASSVVVSGTEIRRPRGQTKPDDASPPVFGPCRMLDYELEVGFFIGRGNDLGRPIPVEQAEDHVFGLCLVNDWSARDVQKWEYQPLGPFLAKSFATTISPYVVTMEALAPFRCPAYRRPEGDPRPLPYLHSEESEQSGGIDITLEVFLASKQMRDRGLSPVRLSRGSFRDMYWTIAQMIAHHTSNGCNLRPGDLLASGTVSGPAPESRGCLLELTWDGPGKPRKPIELPTGEKRLFLEDGDEVILKGSCERDGFRRIGFGECRGIIAPAGD